VPKDSPIETVADLRGKRLGVWSTGAGAFKAARAAIIDATGLDVVKDTKISQLAPPALFKLLEKGDVDAMINISSLTVQAAAQPDKFRSVFSPVVWAAPLVAWKSWVNENPARAKNYAAAVEASFRWLRKPENFDVAVKKYGTLAGVTTPATIAVYKKWLGEKRIFLDQWDQKVVDAQWQFLEMAQHHNVPPAVPDKNAHALLITEPKG